MKWTHGCRLYIYERIIYGRQDTISLVDKTKDIVCKPCVYWQDNTHKKALTSCVVLSVLHLPKFSGWISY